MWTGAVGLGDSLVISALGFLVVFCVLIVLALATMLISKVVGLFTKPRPGADSTPQGPADGAETEAVLAALHAALSLELELGPEETAVTSIEERTE